MSESDLDPFDVYTTGYSAVSVLAMKTEKSVWTLAERSKVPSDVLQ